MGNDLKRWTVYAHINKLNHKMYIGITSQPVMKRWGNGFGYSECPKFYNAIKKYGWNGFEHKILFEYLIESDAKDVERFMIEFLDLQDDRYGYNITDGGDGVCGYRHTEKTKELLRQKYYAMSDEARQRMIQGRKGITLTSEHKIHISKGCINKGIKRICQYNLDGTFIKEWDSLSIASKNLNIQISDISNCCHNKKSTAGGYMWQFSDGTYNDISPYHDNFNRKKIEQYSKDGVLLHIWDGSKDIKNNLGFREGNISMVCNNFRHTAYGYKWKYVD